jgi:hypothetical protein
MPSLKSMIDAYLAGPPLLRKAVAGMSREQLKARPVPGKWSTLEVVCHLADFEPVYADRMKRIIAEERPIIHGADQEKFARSLAYLDRELEEELSIIENTRKQLARILRTQPAEVLSRSATHQEGQAAQPRTLERYLELITNHIPHHTKFIIEKRRALGLAD